jgi:transcriptional regulator with XRE-family HTH domain
MPARKQPNTETYAGRFANRLQILRKKAKLTVEELAEQTGIPRTSLYNWESATRQPLIGQLPNLAAGLGVKIGKLFPEE